MREGSVEADGMITSFIEAGSGPAVILSAGLGLTGRFYRRNLEAFAAAGLRLVVPAQPRARGSGGSVRGLDVPATAYWLASFAEALGIDRAGWLGHSIGAQSALRVAAEYPTRAAALVLVGPTGAPRRLRLLREMAALARTVPRESGALLRAVAHEYVRTSPVRYLGTWIRAARDHPLRHAPDVRCPALLIAGERDPLPPRAYLELLRQRIPQARVEYVAGGAHGLPFDHAEEFNRLAISFLRETLLH